MARRRIKKRPEEVIQRAVADYLDVALPAGSAWTMHKAGGLGWRDGGIAQGMGLKPGWPDVQILYCGRFIGIELKSNRGTVSDIQKQVHQQIVDASCFVRVCRSVEEVDTYLRALGVPMKGHIMGLPGNARPLGGAA